MNTKAMGWMVGILLVTLACGMIAPTQAPTQQGVETIVAQTIEAITAAAPQVTQTPEIETATSAPPAEATPTKSSQLSGTPVSFQNVSIVIPTELAGGANTQANAAVSDQGGPGWDAAPAYSKFTLTGYPLQGKFFEPYIAVYPAHDYESVNAGAGESLKRLRAILANPSSPLSKDNLPGVPGFNAAMVFASNAAVIPMQNGSGVRILTEYAQYFATVNNHDMFYQFQGLTSDGNYYVIAVLPVNAPFLAAESDPASPLPADGIPFPGYDAMDGTSANAYYQAVTDKLNALSPDAFTPSITALDSLIQSITITP